MGWSSGTNIMEGVIDAVSKNVESSSVRYKIYKDIYEVMRNADWDNVDEVLGIDEAFDQVAAEDGWGNDWEDE